MVPTESLCLENGDDNDGEHSQGNGFLYDFQLDKVEGTAIGGRANAVGRDHEGILEQGDAPRHQDDQEKRPVFRRGDNLEQL